MKNIQSKTYIKGKIDYNYTALRNEKDSDDMMAPERIKFKIFKGKSYKGQETFMEFIPDKDGSFLLELPPGQYSIVEKERTLKFEFDKNKDQKWDKQCLKREWSAPLATFKVKISEPINVEFKYSSFDATEHPCLKNNAG